jgi:hypothetical protein
VKLAASLRDPAAARAAWQARSSVRFAPFLDDEVAHTLRLHLRAQPFGAAPPSASVRLQYEAFTNIPEAGCDHFTCMFARWMWDELPAWLEQVTGRRFHPPISRELVAMMYRRGSYLDLHNDRDPVRKLAFVIGLTDTWWPPEAGGHLEFVEPDDDRGLRLIERRAPGWNTLDLFAVDTHDRLHQVPQLVSDLERLTISGWFI